jgi:hypothetical protein
MRPLLQDGDVGHSLRFVLVPVGVHRKMRARQPTEAPPELGGIWSCTCPVRINQTDLSGAVNVA